MRARGGLADLAAASALVAALLLPDRLTATDLGSFAALPVELVLGAVFLLGSPARLRRQVAVVLGLLLGALTLLKIIDIGFYAAVSRPFDPVLDWRLASGAWQLLVSSLGLPVACMVVVAAVGVVLGLPMITIWSVLRLTRRLTHHPRTVPAVAALTALWLTFAATGLVIATPYPVASHATTSKIIDEIAAVRAGRLDQQRLAGELGSDRFHGVPGDRLLTGLRGKRVLVIFVESYGRVAVEDPAVDPPVLAALTAGERRLTSAGLAARSGFLTSSTTGGGSWLAHATLLSGLWIDSQRRYLTLTASDRLTLTEAFQRADWRTVAMMPGMTSAWPEGAFYHYDEIHDATSLGYTGPPYTWARVPDQYTLAQLDRLTARSANGQPTMAVAPLVTSHAPWTAIPPSVPPDRAGDSASYGTSSGGTEPPETIRTGPASRVQADYGRAISYSLTSVFSYLSSEPSDDLVVIMLGDHQPASVVTGGATNRDVPISVISRDPEVLRRIAGWQWTPGLRPAADAPVWRMDAFRDRFLGAFSTGP